MRVTGSNKIAPIIQGALRLQTTAKWAKKLRAKFCEVWRAPPQLSARGAHLWWELISSSGLAASASESEWHRTIGAMEEVLIFGLTQQL